MTYLLVATSFIEQIKFDIVNHFVTHCFCTVAYVQISCYTTQSCFTSRLCVQKNKCIEVLELSCVSVRNGGQMAERLGSRAITQKVVGSIPGCAK